mmetsp:Transcript_12925/g.39885  ORF Transcript_12925/g.39885 Transcript_12925/m.39885 type:complete len:536 (+) Transcript_12925:47-1654(+)
MQADLHSRLVQTHLDIGHQQNAWQLLKVAVEKEGSFNARETQRLDDLNVTHRLSETQDNQNIIGKLLQDVDVLLHAKQRLSVDCRDLAAKFKVDQKFVHQDILSVLQEHDVELRSLQHMWDCQAASRRRRYLQVQTESARQLTVRGLEPELQQLMQKHKFDRKERHARRNGTWNAKHSEMKSKLAARRITSCQTLQSRHAEGELDEKTRHQKIMNQLEERARYGYTTQEQFTCTRQLSREPQRDFHRYAAKYQHEHGRLHATTKNHIDTRRARLCDVQNFSRESLGLGCRVVRSARSTDRMVCFKMARAQIDANMISIVAATKAKLRRQRNANIDILIRRDQARALEWEQNKSHTKSSGPGHTHRTTVATLQSERGLWAEKNITRLRETQLLANHLSILRAIKAATDRHRQALTLNVAHLPKFCATKNECASRNITLWLLDDECVAADVTGNSVTIAIQHLVTSYRSTKSQHIVSHQEILTSKNDEVRCELCTNASSLEQIAGEVALERVRLAHLGKLVTCYRGERLLRNQPSGR